MSSTNTSRYWFPAKRYGWGWGPPCTWQGWVVSIVYFALVIAGIPLIKVPQGSIVYIGYTLVLTLALIAICWLKGEPPGWRWGDDN